MRFCRISYAASVKSNSSWWLLQDLFPIGIQIPVRSQKFSLTSSGIVHLDPEILGSLQTQQHLLVRGRDFTSGSIIFSCGTTELILGLLVRELLDWLDIACDTNEDVPSEYIASQFSYALVNSIEFYVENK